MKTIVFSVIYSFHIKPSQAKTFEEAWRNLTLLIYEYEGSLGSRLHKQSELLYIAYAQWPSKAIWKNSGGNLPESAVFIRQKMKSAIKKMETIHELELVDDLLKSDIKKKT